MAAVAALPDEAEICGCNGVCKGKIVKAITDGRPDHASTRSAPPPRPPPPAASAPASSSRCWPSTLGDAFVLPAAKPMCKCTDLTHEDVRRLIKARALKSMPAVWQELGWKTSCGCHSCRPALNFYLLADWPDDYQDDAQSPLHQRARPRQHPEGRHLLGGAADVGRRHHAAGAARHRRRRREVRRADGQGDRRPAPRPARREEGGPAGDVGRPRTPPASSPATPTPRACAR